MVFLSRKFLLINLPKCSPSRACAQEAILLQPRALNELSARFGLFPFRSPLLREYWTHLAIARCRNKVGICNLRLRNKLRYNCISTNFVCRRQTYFRIFQHFTIVKCVRCFLFLRLLRCFTSAGSLPMPLTGRVSRFSSGWVSPFGNLRIKGC